MYDKGHGVPQDDAEAVTWIRKAAEQGFALAQNTLAAWYKIGKGVAQDHAEAAKWFSEAAEQGNADAQNNLGAIYGKGSGSPAGHDPRLHMVQLGRYGRQSKRGEEPGRCGPAYDGGRDRRSQATRN
jgi:TPR repeat protein